MPNVMAAQPNIHDAVCVSSIIPFIVPRRKVWLLPAARVPCSNVANIGECKAWMQSEVCTWQNYVTEQKPPKSVYIYIYSIPAQETAKHRVKFGWPPVNDVAAVTKLTRETRWNLLGCPKLTNRSQMLVGRSSPYCKSIRRRYCHLTLTSFFSDCRCMP